jgi:hypothetical protein
MSTTSLYDSHIQARDSSRAFSIVVTLLLCAGIVYAGTQLYRDLASAPAMSFAPYALLGRIMKRQAPKRCRSLTGWCTTPNKVSTAR